MKLTAFWQTWPKEKKIKLLLAGAMAAAILLLYFLPSGKHTDAQSVISNNTDTVTSEAQLENVLSKIRGAGQVKVMITYETSREVVTATTVQRQTNTVTERTENGGVKESETVQENQAPVTVGSGSGENALIVLQKEPEIKGVLVVAQGAGELSVRMNLQKAVETVLQISPDQVEIFAMN